MATKYINKRNGKVAEILKQDQTKGTVILVFEDGSNTCVTTGTLKRWYKELKEAELEVAAYESVTDINDIPDDEYVKQVMQQKKDLNIECPSIDHFEIVSDSTTDGGSTPLSEVGKEIAEQAKDKADKAKKQKAAKPKKAKQDNAWVEQAIQFVYSNQLDAEASKANNVNLVIFKQDGRGFVKFNYTGKSISIAVRKDCLPKDIQEPSAIINHSYNAVYTFKQALTDKDLTLISNLFEAAREYTINKHPKKEEH